MRARPIVIRATLIGAALLIGCALSETTLRLLRPYAVSVMHQPLIYRSDTKLGYRYIPNTRDSMRRGFEIDNQVVINSRGFHDIEHDSDASGMRIVVVGDSLTAGLQVPRDRTWPRVLEAELRRSRSTPDRSVINLGMDGIGPEEELEILMENMEDLNPDMVLLQGNRLKD